jgi:hypothetical protein
MLAAPVASTDPIALPVDAKMTVQVVTVNGSGCPLGSTTVATSKDNTAFTVIYNSYTAQVGPEAKSTDFRKNCQLNVIVQVPNGFTYAIAQVDYRGYANLAKGATAIERANYYFQGNAPTVYTVHNFAGPMDGNWQTTDTAEMPAVVYAPCGELRNLNINTELRVNAGTSPKTATSFISMDSVDTAINTIYHLAFKKCPAA